MKWNRNTSNLRDHLAGIYWERDDAVRVLRSIGISPAYVNLSGKMINVWTSIVEYAMHQSLLDELIAQAREEYPKDKLLLMAQEKRLLAVATPDIDDARWLGSNDETDLEILTQGINTLRPVAFLARGQAMANAVGRVVLANGESGTGFLIRDNLLLTNHHVLSSIEDAAHAQVEFNYQEDVNGLAAPVDRYGFQPDVLFHTSPLSSQGGDDWTVVKVAGDANAKWGQIPLQPVTAQRQDEVIIIQHPGGGPKQIALSHNIVTYAGQRRVQYLTDTQKGSSGSPVFNLDWQVVAIHHAGGRLREPGTQAVYYRNAGIAINVVLAELANVVGTVHDSI